MLNVLETKKSLVSALRNLLNNMQKENGQSLVEFTFVIGLLLMFTFALVDFSRYVYVTSTIHAAAQEGARYGIGELGYGNSVDTDSVQNAVRSKVMGLDPSQVNVTVTAPDADTVEVAVTYEFSFITPLNALANYVLHHSLDAGPWQVSSTASMLKQ